MGCPFPIHNRFVFVHVESERLVTQTELLQRAFLGFNLFQGIFEILISSGQYVLKWYRADRMCAYGPRYGSNWMAALTAAEDALSSFISALSPPLCSIFNWAEPGVANGHLWTTLSSNQNHSTDAGVETDGVSILTDSTLLFVKTTVWLLSIHTQIHKQRNSGDDTNNWYCY